MNLPRLELYSGREQAWKDFYAQFRRHSRVNRWTEQEMPVYLSMHLKGEALHYYEQLPRRVQDNYQQAADAMQQRFGQASTAEAQKAAFQNLQQKEKEPLQEFADRVRGTAIEAFPGLPTEYVEMEMIGRFFRGILAKEAGLFGLNNKYRSLEKAVQAIQVYIENKRSVFGLMRVRTLESGGSSDGEEYAKVRYQNRYKEKRTDMVSTETTPAATAAPPSSSSSKIEGMDEVRETLTKIQQMLSRHKPVETGELKASTEERLQLLERNLKEIQDSLRYMSQTSRGVESNIEQRRRMTFSEGRRRRSPSPDEIMCFRCQKKGHMARECTNERVRSPSDSRSPSPRPRVGFNLNQREGIWVAGADPLVNNSPSHRTK